MQTGASCGFFAIPRGRGCATATASAALFFPTDALLKVDAVRAMYGTAQRERKP
jgi:hypothetical protein